EIRQAVEGYRLHNGSCSPGQGGGYAHSVILRCSRANVTFAFYVLAIYNGSFIRKARTVVLARQREETRRGKGLARRTGRHCRPAGATAARWTGSPVAGTPRRRGESRVAPISRGFGATLSRLCPIASGLRGLGAAGLDGACARPGLFLSLVY